MRALKKRLRSAFTGARSASSAPTVEDGSAEGRLPEPFRKLREANRQAAAAYVPRPYPGRVTIFRARVQRLFRLYGPDLGWSSLAQGGVQLIGVPGNHESLLQEPHVQALAERLKDCLLRGAQTGRSEMAQDRPVLIA